MKPPGPTERYWIVVGSAGLAVAGAAPAVTGRRGASVTVSLGCGAAAGFGAGAGLAAFGAGGALAFFSFSSPGFTGEGRDSRPRRCALPMTALRLTPPSSSAIWLAVAPSVHIDLRRSMRSSVQLMKFKTPCVLRAPLCIRAPADRRLSRERPDSLLGKKRTRQAKP